MQFTITGKHIDITEAIKQHAEDRAHKLPKFYNSIDRVEMLVDASEGGYPSVEIIARGEHNKVFVVSEKGDGVNDMYACIDLASHKMENQLRKAKQKERNPIHASNAE